MKDLGKLFEENKLHHENIKPIVQSMGALLFTLGSVLYSSLQLILIGIIAMPLSDIAPSL